MKIGFITGEYPPMEGGVGAFTRELARELARAGHDLHVISSREARPSRQEGGNYSLGQLREPVDLGYALLHPVGRRWRWSDIGRVASIALRYELDVLDLQYQAAAYNMGSAAVNLGAWRLKSVAPVVVTFHDLRVPYLFPKAGPIRRLVVRFMARQASGVIATNSVDIGTLLEWGVTDRRLRQIPIGSNIAPRRVTDEARRSVRRRLGVGPGDCLLAFFGFVNESKGADDLVHALAKLNESTHLVFVGGATGTSDRANNTSFLESLNSEIARLNLDNRLHWSGFLPDRDVSEHLAAADLIVLPYRDGVSLRRGTLMAALAHGRPTLSTRPVTPVPALEHGTNIWLVPPSNPDALAAAIRRLMADASLRGRLGQAARATAASFSWQQIAEDTATFLRDVADV